MDLSLFNNVPGLLSNEQQGNVNSEALMSAAAALMKASGPSPYKNMALPGIGEGIQGLLNGYNTGTDKALKQTLTAGQIMQQRMGVAQMIATYKALGIPLPGMPAGMPGVSGGQPSAAPVAPGPQAPAAPPVAPGPMPPPGLLSPPSAQGPAPAGGPPMDGAITPPQAPMPAPGPAPAPANMPPGAMGVLQSLPVGDRALIAAGGPAGVSKVVGQIAAKNAEATPAAKDARDPAVFDAARRTKVMEDDVKGYGQLYRGIQSQGHTSAGMLPNIQMAKALINDPDFNSGITEKISLAWKRAAAQFGGDPNAAVPQEAFRKIMAANILHQIDDMKAAATEMGSSSSRIFQSQIELMEKAAQNPDNSVASNKFLTELSERAAKLNIKLADMAADYKDTHGALNAGFEKSMRKYMVENPMFTKDELKQPSLLAGAPPRAEAPAAPAGPPKVASQAEYAKLAKGTQYTAPDGSIRTKQ